MPHVGRQPGGQDGAPASRRGRRARGRAPARFATSVTLGATRSFSVLASGLAAGLDCRLPSVGESSDTRSGPAAVICAAVSVYMKASMRWIRPRGGPRIRPHQDISWGRRRHITAGQELCSLFVDISSLEAAQFRFPTACPPQPPRASPNSREAGVLEMQWEVCQGRPVGPSRRDRAKRGP